MFGCVNNRHTYLKQPRLRRGSTSAQRRHANCPQQHRLLGCTARVPSHSPQTAHLQDIRLPGADASHAPSHRYHNRTGQESAAQRLATWCTACRAIPYGACHAAETAGIAYTKGTASPVRFALEERDHRVLVSCTLVMHKRLRALQFFRPPDATGQGIHKEERFS